MTNFDKGFTGLQKFEFDNNKDIVITGEKNEI